MSYIFQLRGESKSASIPALETSAIVALKIRVQLATLYPHEGGKLLAVVGQSEENRRFRWLWAGGNGVSNVWGYVAAGGQTEEIGGFSTDNGDAATDWVVLYAAVDTSNNTIEAAGWNETKARMAFDVSRAVTATVPSGSGQGAFTSGTFGDINFDGIALYTQKFTGTNRFTPPTASDPGLVTAWVFEEQNGNNLVSGAPALSIHANSSFVAGGVWGDDGPPPAPGLDPGTITESNKTHNSVTLTVAPSGGTPPYSYSWHRGTTPGFTPGPGNKVG